MGIIIKNVTGIKFRQAQSRLGRLCVHMGERAEGERREIQTTKRAIAGAVNPFTYMRKKDGCGDTLFLISRPFAKPRH